MNTSIIIIIIIIKLLEIDILIVPINIKNKH